MATLTSKLEIHRAIIKVRRKIELAESLLACDRNVSLKESPEFADEEFPPGYDDSTDLATELYKLAKGTTRVPEGILLLEAEYLAPLEAAAAALELSAAEEKDVQDLRNRMTAVAAKAKPILEKGKSQDIKDEGLALEAMVLRAGGEEKRNKETRADCEVMRSAKELIFVFYHIVVFVGALVVITS